MPRVRPKLPFPTLGEASTELQTSCPPEFLAGLASLGIEIPEAGLDRLCGYVDLLLSASRLLNLTALREPSEIWMKLVLDALALRPMLGAMPTGARVIDVGTGAGLPGLPLAIACPWLRFTLLDATAKKVAFLDHAVGELRLDNVRTLAARAEQAASAQPSGSEREAHDFVVARAVAPLSVLLEFTVPFARAPQSSDGGAGGRILLTKGERARDELNAAGNALRLLQVRHVATHQTPTGHVLVFEKRAATPPRYPRGNGVPKRSPL